MGIEEDLQAMAAREQYLTMLREMPLNAKLLTLTSSDTQEGMEYDAILTDNVTAESAYFMCGQYMNHILFADDPVEGEGHA